MSCAPWLPAYLLRPVVLCALVTGAGLLSGCERKPEPAAESSNSPASGPVGNVSAYAPEEQSAPDGRGPAFASGPREPQATGFANPAPAAAGDSQSATTGPAELPAVRVVAYYFHGTLRCPECLAIQEQSQEAIEGAYAEELATGRLEWQAVDIDQPGNEHFRVDFKLDRQSLVLVELEGETVRRYRKLEQVWELLGDPYELEEYVVSEVALFLAGG